MLVTKRFERSHKKHASGTWLRCSRLARLAMLEARVALSK